MKNGLDVDGYIVNPCTDTIQHSYKGLVDHSCQLIRSLLQDRLHSIYLYGSVARGAAVEGKSDLDLVVLFQSKPSDQETKKLKLLEDEINASSMTLVGFDVGDIQEVQGFLTF